MKAAWHIFRHDLLLALRTREVLVWVVLMPPVFMGFIGAVTGGFGASQAAKEGSKGTPLEVVGAEAGDHYAQRLLQRLEALDFRVLPVSAASEFHPRHPRLTLPTAFSERIEGRPPAKLLLSVGPSPLLGAEAEYRIQRAVAGLLGDLLILDGEATTAGRRSQPTDPADSTDHKRLAQRWAELDAAERSVRLEVRPAGERRRIPSGFEQAVPGILVMFTLLVLLSNGAVALVAERDSGRLARIFTSPVAPGVVLAAKSAALVALALVQILIAVVTGQLLFSVPLLTHLPAIAPLLFAWALFCAALAALTGAWVRSASQATVLAVIVANVMAALGGCWWPLEIAPRWLRSLGEALPTAWAMGGIQRVVAHGEGLAATWTAFSWLLLGALPIAALALRRLRRAAL